MLLGFVAPGAGHLYVGRAGLGFAVGSIAVVGFPLWIAIWAKAQFSGVVFLWGLMLIETARRFVGGLWAALIAYRQREVVLLRWQRPLAYGTFLMLFLLTDGNLQGFVFRNLATPMGVPTNAEAPTINQRDSVWLLHTGVAKTPRKGALVFFRRLAIEQNSALFVLEAPQVLGRVVALAGDEVLVTPSAVLVNDQPIPDSAGGKPAPTLRLGDAQVFVVASNHNEPGIVDSRDVGPLPVGDYLGEIALVQSATASLWGRISDAKQMLVE